MKKTVTQVKKGSNTKAIQIAERHIFTTYSRFPITLVKAKGINVWDAEGKKYLDFVSGLAVNNLGHCHPQIIAAIKKQSAELMHVSNLYYNVPQTELARKLTSCSFADRVFFCNSGAEANEAAIKLARKFSTDTYGHGRFEIITMNQSFHGRTMATVSATGQEKVRRGFEPLMTGFKYVPFNDFEGLKKAITPRTCAIMMEPIQGEGGVNIPDQEYMENVRDLCYAKKILLIFDEVQTGIGRTGKLFAYDHFEIKPDVMTLAKGLGGGMPMGAMLAREDVAVSFSPGTHATTFGGNPLSSAVALAAMKAVDRSLLSNCVNMGKYFMKKLQAIKGKCSLIKDIRGKGLMIGVELEIPGKEITEKLLEKGFLVNCTMDRVLRFLPPLIVKKREIESVMRALEKILMEME